MRQGLEAAQEKRQQEERDEKYRAPTADELADLVALVVVFAGLWFLLVFGLHV